MAKKTKQEKITKKSQEEDEDELEEDEEDEEEVEVEEDEVEEEDGEDEEEDDTPAPKKKVKKGEKSGKGSGLVPREPVSVNKEIFKKQTPEVQALLKQREAAQAAGDKKALRKIRAGLRKQGFRLSNVNAASEE